MNVQTKHLAALSHVYRSNNTTMTQKGHTGVEYY